MNVQIWNEARWRYLAPSLQNQIIRVSKLLGSLSLIWARKIIIENRCKLFDYKTIMKNISRMEKFLQMNSLKESMLLVKAKILQACHLHSNFSLTLNSERLMLTVRRKKRLKFGQV